MLCLLFADYMTLVWNTYWSIMEAAATRCTRESSRSCGSAVSWESL